MIVKSKQFFLLRFVNFKVFLKSNRFAATNKVLRAAVVTCVVFWHELLDSDSLSLIDDIVFVVDTRAISTLAL